jgi:hypothetical protein
MRQSHLSEWFISHRVAETQIKSKCALARVQHYSVDVASAGLALQFHDQLAAQPAALVGRIHRHLPHLGESIGKPL